MNLIDLQSGSICLEVKMVFIYKVDPLNKRIEKLENPTSKWIEASLDLDSWSFDNGFTHVLHEYENGPDALTSFDDPEIWKIRVNPWDKYRHDYLSFKGPCYITGNRILRAGEKEYTIEAPLREEEMLKKSIHFQE